MKPTIGRIVIYQTDGRNGKSYQLPAIITCTEDSYADIDDTPIEKPKSESTLHLQIFSPGSAGYQEINVPYDGGKAGSDTEGIEYQPRSWHWPPRV